MNPVQQYRGMDQLGAFTGEFFVYGIEITGITGAAPTGTKTIQTQTDADFLFMGATYSFILSTDDTVTNATQEVPDLTLQIMDSGTGKNLFFTPTQIQCIASNNANLPFWLPLPRTIGAGSSLTFTIASTKTFAGSYAFTFNMLGAKKYRV